MPNKITSFYIIFLTNYLTNNILYKKEKYIMMDLIILAAIIGFPTAALFYTIAKDKKDGANGW